MEEEAILKEFKAVLKAKEDSGYKCEEFVKVFAPAEKASKAKAAGTAKTAKASGSKTSAKAEKAEKPASKAKSKK